MANKDKLRDMLDAIIDDDTTKAEVDFHEYLSGKMKDVMNPEAAAVEDEVVADEVVADDVENTED